MSRERRTLPVFPAIHGEAFGIGRTVRAEGGRALAGAATSACVDFLAQRLSLPRNTGGLYHLFYKPSAPARFLWVSAIVNKVGAWTPLAGATLEVEITDGTNTVYSSDPEIPVGLKNDRTLSAAGFRRWEAGLGEWFIDLADVAAVLDRTLVWRIEVTVRCDATAQLECLTATELPRWWVDDAEAFGVLPSAILPRAIVRDDLQTERLVATLETAHGLPKTYLSIARAEAATATHLTATGTSFVPLSGWEESAGVSLSHVVRAERLGAAGTGTSGMRCKARCRYKVSGASATLRVITAAGSYDLALADTTGSWTDSGDLTLYLATNGTDQLDTVTLKAKLSGAGPTLSIDSLAVWGDPA